MPVPGPAGRAALAADGVQPFVPARFDVAPTPVRATLGPTVAFQVRTLGTDTCRVLRNDPADATPASLGRVAANAAATFVLLLLVGLALLAAAPRLMGYEPVVVTSGSMEPAIDVGDVVVTTPSDGRSLSDGAVINFELEDGTRLHRIVEVTDDGYRTAGDANDDADSDLIVPTQVHGIGTVVVPFVGLPSLWVDNGRWVQLGLAVSLLAGCLYISRAAWVEPESAPWT